MSLKELECAFLCHEFSKFKTTTEKQVLECERCKGNFEVWASYDMSYGETIITKVKSLQDVTKK